MGFGVRPRPSPSLNPSPNPNQIFWEDDDPPTWYSGTVMGWRVRVGRLAHHILYDDRQRQLEYLEDLQWRLLHATGEPEEAEAGAAAAGAAAAGAEAAAAGAAAGAGTEQEAEVVVMPSEGEAGAPRTRSRRREVKLQEEDVVDGLMRCPGCGLGVHMADGGCNVTTCRHTSKHGGRYYYFCAHCKAECPDGESLCTSSNPNPNPNPNPDPKPNPNPNPNPDQASPCARAARCATTARRA